MTEPRRTAPTGDGDSDGDGPSHPPLRAFLVVVGVVLAILVLAIVSTFGLL